MLETVIERLKEALQFSPDNVPLRTHLAETYFDAGKYADAEREYLAALAISTSDKVLLGLARVYYASNSFSKCNVILEDLKKRQPDNIDLLVLYARSSLKENAIVVASETYQKILQLQPSFKDDELEQNLKVAGHGDNHDVESANDLPPVFSAAPDKTFQDVGGMSNIKKEISNKIIQPLKHPDLYKAYGKKAGGGILLYGPPGCGKTLIARATAGEVNARFINVGLTDILDMWIGNSEKNLHNIFEYARANTPCVIFFDEIDALGSSRNDMKHSAGRHLINQFLLELDGASGSNEGILIIGATNTPWNLDVAFRRPGRFDRIIFVPPPDEEARKSILTIKLANKPVDGIDHASLAKALNNYSGADIDAVIDIAVEEKLEAAMQGGVPQPLRTRDLEKAIKKHKASTIEWFSTARNFALYANEAGYYDDILHYLKIKK